MVAATAVVLLQRADIQYRGVGSGDSVVCAVSAEVYQGGIRAIH